MLASIERSQMNDHRCFTTAQALSALLENDDEERELSSGSDMEIQTQVTVLNCIGL